MENRKLGAGWVEGEHLKGDSHGGPDSLLEEEVCMFFQ